MKRNYKTYILQSTLIICLFLGFFCLKSSIYVNLSIFLIMFMIISLIILKKRNLKSLYSRQVTFFMILFAGVYIGIAYLLGLRFGFAKASVRFGIWGITHYIIPISIIIVVSEILRRVFNAQEKKLTKVFNIIAMVIIDMIIYTQIYNIEILDDFLAIIGFVIFSSISCNLLYEFISSKYGAMPVILYRILTSVYMYVFPYIPDIYIFLRTVLRMLYPIVIYLGIDFAFEKKKSAIDYKKRNKNYISIAIISIVSILIAMMVSCKFKYGIMVVGSGSMSGTMNKGDATVFEQYNSQELKINDVIIFYKDNKRMIHRIVSIKKVGSINKYYTKGDANSSMDNGYIEDSDIMGVCKFKISYIGCPTLWLRNIFNNI